MLIWSCHVSANDAAELEEEALTNAFWTVSVDLFARDIAAVLEYVDDPGAVIVAHSIGGAAA